MVAAEGIQGVQFCLLKTQLDQILAQTPPDFSLVFSSISLLTTVVYLADTAI